MRRSKSSSRLQASRLCKVTLAAITFVSVPFLTRSTIIALTGTESPLPEKKANAKPLSAAEAAYYKMISHAGEKYGVDPELIRLVIHQESGFKTTARSHKNAQGLMQLIPETAQRFGVRNPYDPQQNIDGGANYLRWLLDRFNGDVRLALAGYNAGENAVKRYGNRVPPYEETRRYVKRIAAAYGKSYHAVPARASQSFAAAR